MESLSSSYFPRVFAHKNEWTQMGIRQASYQNVSCEGQPLRELVFPWLRFSKPNKWLADDEDNQSPTNLIYTFPK